MVERFALGALCFGYLLGALGVMIWWFSGLIVCAVGCWVGCFLGVCGFRGVGII